MLGDKSENIAQLLRAVTLQSFFRGPASKEVATTWLTEVSKAAALRRAFR
jgi:hypothetical protein